MLARRDVIRFATGGAIGTALTPLPWKLLDDTSIWTQNWSLIPPVPRGEVTVKTSTCTLCPAACGVRAKCVGGRAAVLEGIADHPLSHGVLCAAGLGGHAAAYHPRRIREARRGDAAELKAALGRGRFAILDLGPMRAASALYAQAAASLNGMYLRVPDRDEAFLDRMAAAMGREPGSLGVDLEHTRTLVSFGAPVLEEWGTPGRVFARRRSGGLKVIQIDPRQSRTALAADRWFPVAPPEDELLNSVERPAVAVGDPERAPALNVALGAVGVEGGIVARAAEPWGRTPWKDLAAAEHGSISLLIIDASRAYDVVAWPSIQRKLAADALVIAFAYKEDAITRRAQWVLPVSAPFETIEDAETPPCAAVPSYAVSSPLIEPAAVATTPVDHLNELFGAGLPSIEDAIKERMAKVERAEPGVWVGDPGRERLTAKPIAPPPAPPKQDGLLLLASAARAHDSNPLLTKLYQESGLYTPFTLARIHPETARSLNLKTNDKAVLENSNGSAVRTILADPAVMPGAVEVALSADNDDIANLCGGGSAVTVRRS